MSIKGLVEDLHGIVDLLHQESHVVRISEEVLSSSEEHSGKIRRILGEIVLRRSSLVVVLHVLLSTSVVVLLELLLAHFLHPVNHVLHTRGVGFIVCVERHSGLIPVFGGAANRIDLILAEIGIKFAKFRNDVMDDGSHFEGLVAQDVIEHVVGQSGEVSDDDISHIVHIGWECPAMESLVELVNLRTKSTWEGMS